MDAYREDLAWQKENKSWKLDKNDNSSGEPAKANDDARCQLQANTVRFTAY